MATRSANLNRQCARRADAERALRLRLCRGLLAVGLVLFCPSVGRAFLAEYQAAVTNEPTLISYYTFDAGNATDVHGTNNGTLMGTTAFAAGTGGFGQALSLSGAGWVSLGVVGDLRFANDYNGSIEAWLKAGTLKGNACIFANRDGFTESEYSIHMNSNKDGIGMWNGSLYFPTIPIPNPSTNWHHLVVVFADGYYTVFWDGALAGTLVRPFGYNPIGSTQIGSPLPWSNDECWDGLLDEVAFYADALAPEAVQAHYDAFLEGNPPVIAQQPQGGTYLPGAALTLTVQATGPKLAYQWYKGATPLAGETTTTLSFVSLSAGDAGTYSVRVSNVTAIVTSSNAVVALASLPAALARYQSAVSNEASLISYYTFDRLIPEDVYGWNEGTLAGTAGWGEGISGSPARGLLLDGAGHVNLGPVYDFHFLSGEGTVEGWIRADWTNTSGSTYRCMFADRDNASGFSAATWSMHLSANKGSLTYFNGSGSDDYAVPGGAGMSWHHFAAVLRNGTNTYYWDGTPITTKIRALGTTYWSTQLGSSAPNTTSEGWVGMLDEVAFYSAALPAASIQAHYGAFVAGDPPVITSQPAGGYYLSGQMGQLSVGTSGALLTYQWYKDGVQMPGYTNALIGPLPLTATHTGKYYVTVANPSGSTNSATAIVVVGNDMARYQATVHGESSLISYYTFDNSDAQDARSAHPGTVVNSVAYEAGAGGVTNLSLSLDGTGHIDLGQVADFDFIDGSGTVEGWIRPNWINPAPYDPCLFADRDGEGSVWSAHMGMWKTVIMNFSSGAQSLPIGSDGNWHHYAIVFEANTVSMYWDGIFRGSFNQIINSSLAKTTQIGSSTPTITTEGWMGGLDEVAFYSTALGAETIRNHYLAMVGPPSLSIAVAGGQVTISWPANVAGFTLEYAETLPTTTWWPVGGVANNQVTVEASASKRFYRLRL